MTEDNVNNEKRLALMLLHCKTSVRYYRDKWQHGSALSLQDLPYLTRDSVAAAGKALLSERHLNSPLWTRMTSGTTGQPLVCYIDSSAKLRQAMALWNCRRRFNPDLPFGARLARFGALKTINSSNRVQVAKKGNELVMSPCIWDRSTIMMCLRAIAAFKPQLLKVTPSILDLLTSTTTTLRLARFFDSISVIESAGEYLSADRMQEYINRTPIPIANHYGMQECMCVAYSCRENRLHLTKENVVEIAEDGHLVVSPLSNTAWPLLRYLTSDRGELSGGCGCGSEAPLLFLEQGRSAAPIKIDKNKSIDPIVFGASVARINRAHGRVVIQQFQAKIRRHDQSIELSIVFSGERPSGTIEQITTYLQLNLLQVAKVAVVVRDSIPPDVFTGKVSPVVLND